MADSLADQLRAKTDELAAKSKERDAARARFLSTLGIDEELEAERGIIVHILERPRRGVSLPSDPGKRWIYSDDYPDDPDLREHLFLDGWCERLDREIPVIDERLRRTFDSPAVIIDLCRVLLDELERFDKPFHVGYYVYWMLDALHRMRGVGQSPSIPDEQAWMKSEFRISDIGLPAGVTHIGLQKLLGEIIDAAEGIDRLTPSGEDHDKPATGQPQAIAEASPKTPPQQSEQSPSTSARITNGEIMTDSSAERLCTMCGGPLTSADIDANRVCESCLNANKRFTLSYVHRLISLGDDLTKCDPLDGGVGWSQVRHLAGDIFGHNRTDKEILDRVIALVSSETGKIREAAFVMSLADVADVLERSLPKEAADSGNAVNPPDGEKNQPERDGQESNASVAEQKKGGRPRDPGNVKLLEIYDDLRSKNSDPAKEEEVRIQAVAKYNKDFKGKKHSKGVYQEATREKLRKLISARSSKESH